MATAADLTARYPEFAGVSQAVLDAVVAEAGGFVDDTWIEADRQPATLALAAHMLASEGYPAKATAGYDHARGAVTERTVGQVSTKFGGNASVGRGGTDVYDYAGSAYGRAYLMYLRRSHGGPRLSNG